MVRSFWLVESEIGLREFTLVNVTVPHIEISNTHIGRWRQTGPEAVNHLSMLSLVYRCPKVEVPNSP